MFGVCEWGWWINRVRVQDWEGVEKVLDRIEYKKYGLIVRKPGTK